MPGQHPRPQRRRPSDHPLRARPAQQQHRCRTRLVPQQPQIVPQRRRRRCAPSRNSTPGRRDASPSARSAGCARCDRDPADSPNASSSEARICGRPGFTPTTVFPTPGPATARPHAGRATSSTLPPAGHGAPHAAVSKLREHAPRPNPQAGHPRGPVQPPVQGRDVPPPPPALPTACHSAAPRHPLHR